MMASNRKQPFGYELRNGRVCLQTEEAETVQWVFQQYVAGRSYSKLTEGLNQRGVAYLPNKPWNKNMVARMLEDKRYIGTEDHPAIVDEDLLERAMRLRAGRTVEKKRDDTTKELQRLAVCGACGENMVRTPHIHGRERWNCPACKSISRAVTDAMLKENTRDALNRLILTPSVVQRTPSVPVADHSTERIEQELREQMAVSDSEETALTKLAFDLAAARYAQLNSEDYETERVRRSLQNAPPVDTLDLQLLRSIISAILVHPNGNIQFKLKNNQII